jgi:Predicted Fe-S-cluster oxidoreductase
MDYKEITKLNYLEPDDTFRFGCDCCGGCCKERGDTLLTAYDIMRLQEYLGISFKELLITYCELYVGKDSGLPIVRIRTDARCPFLIRNKCLVQDAKPAVCSLFPLGRIYDGEKVRYFLQEGICGTGAEEHTLHEWLKPLGSNSESCCILWWNMLKEGVEIIKQAREQNNGLEEMILDFMVFIMYDGYDSKKSPISQMQERIEVLKQLPVKIAEFSELEIKELLTGTGKGA